jgi:hypothetical protein
MLRTRTRRRRVLKVKGQKSKGKNEAIGSKSKVSGTRRDVKSTPLALAHEALPFDLDLNLPLRL